MKIHILTISAPGAGASQAGPYVEKVVLHHYPQAEVSCAETGNGPEQIRDALARQAGADFIITLGGIGITAGEVAPEVTQQYCERLLPGIAEMLRSESYKHSPYASLSRGTAGIRGSTIIVNIPGSLKAALFCTRLLIPLIGYCPKMLRGEVHDSYEPATSARI